MVDEGEVVGSRKSSVGHHGSEFFGVDIIHVGDAGIDFVDLALLEVEPYRLETRLGLGYGQRQAYVTQTDHAKDEAAVLDFLKQFIFHTFYDLVWVIRMTYIGNHVYNHNVLPRRWR